jgi:anti-sigma28 factor (negative regulator of flagellin synthesis)
MTTSNNNSTTSNTSLITTTSPINQFDDNKLVFTIIGNVKDNNITSEKVISTDWKEVIGDFISKHEVREKKDGMAFIGASFLSNEDDGVEFVTNNDGISITDNNGDKIVKRNKDNINQYHLLAIDYDDAMTVDEAKERFGEFEHIGYTSHNHKNEWKEVVDKKDEVETTTNVLLEKFRLVFLLTEPVTPDDINNRKDEIFSWVKPADTSTLAIGRLFYLPSCPESRRKHSEVWCNNGKLLDLLSFEVNTNKTIKVSKPVDTEKFSTAVKEAIKNGLKEIGVVNHDPYYKIATSMFSGGMTLQDVIEVSEYLKPNHDQITWLEQWKNSNKLNDISPGFVINLLKEYGIKINQKKTKSTTTKTLELEVKTIEQQIKLFEGGKSDDDIELVTELKTKLDDKQRELKVSETVCVNTFNDDLLDLLERHMLYFVVSDGLIHEYNVKSGEWYQFKLQNFVNDKTFLTDEKGGVDIFLKYMKSQGRVYLNVGLSVKGFKPFERKLNLFRNDKW